MAIDLSTMKPGSTLACTVTKAPRTPDQAATIARLMRQDADLKRGLRRAQRLRKQRLVIYNRGNRDWVKREKTARVVKVEVGQSWSMPFTFDKAADLQSVAAFIEFKAGAAPAKKAK